MLCANPSSAFALVLLVDLAVVGFKPVGKRIERDADACIEILGRLGQVLLDHNHLSLGEVNHDRDAGHYAILPPPRDGNHRMSCATQTVFQPVEAQTDVIVEGGCHLNLVTCNRNFHSRVSFNLPEMEFSVK